MGGLIVPSILYPPTIDWDFMFQRPQQIMRQFAKHGWKVIYCNKHQKRGVPLEEIEPNLFLCHDLFSFIKEGNPVDVFYSTWAKCADLIHSIPHKVVVYDRLDDFTEWESFEVQMMKVADLVLTTSQVLYDKSVKEHNNVHLVRNACDFTHFHNSNLELVYQDKLTRPVFGFIGALGTWIDKEFLQYIADTYTLLTIGPPFGITPPKNAVNFGMKPYQELPKFYKSIDIGLIPFNTNSRVAQAANPIKMYEYLASGKPVLAIETVETSLFPGHVYTCKNTGEVKDYVNRILVTEDEKKKMERAILAKENTWEKRFKVIEKEISILL